MPTILPTCQLRRLRTMSSSARSLGYQHPRATVEVHGRCTGPLHLSGSLDSNVDWIGVGNASHSGGLALPTAAFAPVTSPLVLKLLPKSARTEVLQLNLSALGLNQSSMGKLTRHYYLGGISKPKMSSHLLLCLRLSLTLYQSQSVSPY